MICRQGPPARWCPPLIAGAACSSLTAGAACSTLIAGAAGSALIAGAAGSTLIAGAACSTLIAGAAGSTLNAEAAGSTLIAGAAGSTLIAGAAGSTLIAGAAGSTLIAHRWSSWLYTHRQSSQRRTSKQPEPEPGGGVRFRYRRSTNPLLTSQERYTHLHPVEDRSSRWIEAIPMVSTSAQACANTVIGGWVARRHPRPHHIKQRPAVHQRRVDCAVSPPAQGCGRMPQLYYLHISG
jgi:hypothetical protein